MYSSLLLILLVRTSSSSSSSQKGKKATTSQQERTASQPTGTATAGTTVSVAGEPKRYFLFAVFIIKTSSLPTILVV
jgi:hypothetical protein